MAQSISQGVSNLNRNEFKKLQKELLQQRQTLIPVGSILSYGGDTAPEGWLIGDGSAVSRLTYRDLFSVYGTKYGAGDGSTTFNLPDLRRRVMVGAGGSGTATLGNAVGNIGGAETHTLTVDEMPGHDHDLTTYARGTASHTHAEATDPNGTSSDAIPGTNTTAIQSTGGGQAHNNIQPSLVVNYIIKY
jgi:microcystin-dependent protein